MNAIHPPKKRTRREGDNSPLSPIEQKIADQISEYYRQCELYEQGKLAKRPKLPECTQQKYKDMYDEE